MSAYRLPSQMTIATADACRRALLDYMKGGSGDFELSGEDVERIDAAGVQLLLSALRSATTFGRSLRLIVPSMELQRALDLLGLYSAFGLSKEPGRAA